MKRYETKKMFKFFMTILGFGVLIIPSRYILVGIGLTAFAAVGLLTFGGIRTVTVPPFEDSRQYKECVFGQMYNIRERLRKEKENRDAYRLEQLESWKKARAGAGILAVGYLILVLSYTFAKYTTVSILGIVPGYYIAFMSYSWFWDGFINSQLALAETISDAFGLRSTSTKIKECNKMIAALTKRVRELDEKEAKESKMMDSGETEQRDLQKLEPLDKTNIIV